MKLSEKCSFLPNLWKIEPFSDEFVSFSKLTKRLYDRVPQRVVENLAFYLEHFIHLRSQALKAKIFLQPKLGQN